MRTSLIAAISCAALTAATAAPAFAAGLSPVLAPIVAQTDISDAELRSFVNAMQAVQPIAEASGGAPSPEQQAEMAAAIEASGLPLERFNAISTAISTDAVLRARAELAATAPSPAGSTGAAVTDAEVEQFVAAMAAVRPIAESLNGAPPSPEQQAEMAAAITGAGLPLERFNAISTAVAEDDHLRGRMAVADARRNS
jgi:predicted transcriptional regulator